MDFTINGKPLSALRVVDLKVELEKRGLPKSGNKTDLIERLTQYFVKQAQTQNEDCGIAYQPATKEDMATGVQPPNMSLSHGLTDNDFVRDYLKLRETQFASALSDQDAHLQTRRMQEQPISGNTQCDKIKRSTVQEIQHQGTVNKHDNSHVLLPKDPSKPIIPPPDIPVMQEVQHNAQLKTASDSIKVGDDKEVNIEDESATRRSILHLPILQTSTGTKEKGIKYTVCSELIHA